MKPGDLPAWTTPYLMADDHAYGDVSDNRRHVWEVDDDGVRWRGLAGNRPRHDRHITPYDPRLVVGCETARPGPIARFLMSRVRSAA